MSMESIKSIQESPEAKEEAQEYQFHFSEIEELGEPIGRILSQLHDEIEAGAYQLIIGDDASGRVPALILNNVFKERYHVKGYHGPEIRFVAGAGRDEEKLSKKILSERMELIRRIRDEMSAGENELKKALIVTDIIETGQSLRPLAEALAKNKIKFDIATMKGAYTKQNYAKIFPGAEIVNGNPTHIFIYGRSDISGIKKNIGDLFARPYKEGLGQDMQPDIQQAINEAREDVGALSERLIDWYNEELSNEEESANKE